MGAFQALTLQRLLFWQQVQPFTLAVTTVSCMQTLIETDADFTLSLAGPESLQCLAWPLPALADDSFTL